MSLLIRSPLSADTEGTVRLAPDTQRAAPSRRVVDGAAPLRCGMPAHSTPICGICLPPGRTGCHPSLTCPPRTPTPTTPLAPTTATNPNRRASDHLPVPVGVDVHGRLRCEHRRRRTGGRGRALAGHHPGHYRR